MPPMTDPMELVERLERNSKQTITRYCGDLNGAIVPHDLLTEAAACIREMAEWRPIETAPRDGTAIVGYGVVSGEMGAFVTHWRPYGVGSIAHERWRNGEGPEGAFWHREPVHNWTSRWEPTHWLPLPPSPGAEA